MGAGARHPAARRAHGQPRSERQARSRAPDRCAGGRWRDSGDEHPQPRPGQASGHARGVSGRWATRGRPAGRPFFQRCAAARGGVVSQRRVAVDLKVARRWAFVLAALLAAPTWGQDKHIVMASTTSTEQSGLFGHLLPLFKQAMGIDVRVVAVGTGQALDTGRRGDADVVFVHDTAAEEKFVAEGFATKRLPVMYNDFIVVGPRSDPAK